MRLTIFGEINLEMYQRIFANIGETLPPGTDSIWLDINSQGGSYRTGIAMSQKIQTISEKTIGIVYNFCQSSAILVLLYCDERFGYQDSVFNFHCVTDQQGNVDDKQTEYYYSLIDEKLGHTQWRTYIGVDFGPHVAQEIGLIKEILERAPP